MIRRGSLLVLLLLVPVFVQAQWITDSTFEARSKAGIDAVYDLEFAKADSIFQLITAAYPDHPAGYFFEAMVDWWRIVIDRDNESLDDRFVGKLDKVISICDSILDRNPDDVAALFFKGGALGFRGRLHANRNSWIKAANDGRLALPIVRRAFALAPANEDILLGMGIYNYYAAEIPEQYPLVKPLMVFFPGGDKAKGIAQLQRTAEKARYASVEASYFLLEIYYNDENDLNKALDVASKLVVRFPHNVVFQRYLGRCYVRLKRWYDACACFSSILNRCDSVPGGMTGYGDSARREALYYVGVCSMTHGRYDDALRDFYRCDELSRKLDKSGESGFMTLANLRIGMIFDLQHKRSFAVEQYQKVLGMKDFESAHAIAETCLKTPYTQ